MWQEEMNRVITAGLKQAVHCEIVKDNLCAELPGYPYVSFTITSPYIPESGTDARLGRGRYAAGFAQVWSVTAQSDRDEEASRIAMEARAWFRRAGRLYLDDHGIIVRSVGAVHNRDNLITVCYQYRRGFDVTFALTDVVEFEEPVIETAEFFVGEESH